MLNCIVLQGRFTAEPELKHTQSGTVVCSCTLAVQRSRKDQSGQYPTDFVDVVFWGKTAEMVSKWLGKGDLALVKGRLESRKWEDRNGNKRISWEVQAESVDFCGGQNAKKSVQEVDDFMELPDSDVPF